MSRVERDAKHANLFARLYPLPRKFPAFQTREEPSVYNLGAALVSHQRHAPGIGTGDALQGVEEGIDEVDEPHNVRRQDQIVGPGELVVQLLSAPV